jgi:UDP-N-acetylmuramate--alanine ligase
VDLNKFHSIYLLGIGGIGMSALARYFKFIGKNVGGYDKTPTDITSKLSDEGIDIHFNDSVDEIPEQFKKSSSCLIIYTPAIPSEHKEFNYLKNNGFTIKKRSEILGIITNNYKTIAIAGTHGKTSISTATAHIINQSEFGCLAFLGGISKNYGTNLLLPHNPKFNNQYAVAEADEFDRSFLQLSPSIALVSSMDADHLDIYENHDNIVESFNHFVKKVEPNGIVIYKKGLNLKPENLPEKKYTYSLNEEADFYAKNISINKQGYCNFDLQTPFGLLSNMQSGVVGKLNAENAVAAASVCLMAGISETVVRNSLKTFTGVLRRFDYQVNNEKVVYIDDYAHHPEELKAFISSVREIYQGKIICGVFQPHLYSRTRDFADEFAKSLSLLDELILLDIYPAREEPIPGVSSEIIFDKVNLDKKIICPLEKLEEVLKSRKIEVLLTMGAGNIDNKVASIKKQLELI